MDKYMSVITNFGCHYSCPYCIVKNNNLQIPKSTIDGLNSLEEEIKKNQFIKSLLSEMTDDSNAKEILKLLGMTSNVLTLIVEEDYDDGYCTREVERKEFSDMGELRSYLITEYKMPFEMAGKDINDLYWDDYTFNIEQKENN